MITSKKLKGVCGVYAAINRDNQKLYIGSTINMARRRKEHIRAAIAGVKSCFARALRKYGEDAFDFEIVERCAQHQLKEKEEWWILFFKSASIDGYNTHAIPTGLHTCKMSAAKKGIPAHPNLIAALKGKPRSAESIAKAKAAFTPELRAMLSAQRKGMKMPPRTPEALINIRAAAAARRGIAMSPERREKCGKWHIGAKDSEETKAKRIASFKATMAVRFQDGRKHSAAARSKMSSSHMGNKSNTGRSLTPEHRANISAGNNGKVVTAETRRNLSAAGKGKTLSAAQRAHLSAKNKGKIMSEDARAKISAGLKGHPCSAETRQKMSEWQKGWRWTEESKMRGQMTREFHRCEQTPDPSEVFESVDTGSFTHLQFASLAAEQQMQVAT